MSSPNSECMNLIIWFNYIL